MHRSLRLIIRRRRSGASLWRKGIGSGKIRIRKRDDL